MVFFAAFLCVVALQVLILNIFDSAALAALSNIIAGMIVYSYYRLAGIDILISEIMPIMKIMIVLGLISAILYTFFPDLFSIYEFTDSYGDRRKVSHIAFLPWHRRGKRAIMWLLLGTRNLPNLLEYFLDTPT